MVSYLEGVPHDVLCHIALRCVVAPALEPPHDLLHLLLTNRRIYNSLSIRACPEVYARLFCIKFDTTAAFRRFPTLTTTCLAKELVQRCHVLRRIRRGCVSGPDIRADLWTAFLMILESDGLNEMQLLSAGIFHFIVSFIRNRFGNDEWDGTLLAQTTDTDSVALWLLWLTVSRRIVKSEPSELRKELLLIIRPFATAAFERLSGGSMNHLFPTMAAVRNQDNHWKVISGRFRGGSRCEVNHFSRALTLTCPSLSSAAVLLTFVLKEAVPLQMPPHLSPSPSAAGNTQRSESTTQYPAYATPLPTDTLLEVARKRQSWCRPRSMVCDQDFHRLAPALIPPATTMPPHAYIPGTLTGLWEGTLMVSPDHFPNSTPSLASTQSDFLCRYPMQCRLTEHFCTSPNPPLPTTFCFDLDGSGALLGWNMGPHGPVKSRDVFQVHDVIYAQSVCYDPLSSHSRLGSAIEDGRDLLQALDIILTGETEHEHEVAWGAYKFSGGIRLRDGLIILIREPKGVGDEGLGTWTFEGYLYSGLSFAGNWRSDNAYDRPSLEGIFSLSRREE